MVIAVLVLVLTLKKSTAGVTSSQIALGVGIPRCCNCSVSREATNSVKQVQILILNEVPISTDSTIVCIFVPGNRYPSY